MPDAPELIATFLETENDHTCKRNAFAALSSISHEKALAYLSSVFDGVPNADELLQLVELEFIRKDAIQNSQNKVTLLIIGNVVVEVLTRTRHVTYDSSLTFSRLVPLLLYTKPHHL